MELDKKYLVVLDLIKASLWGNAIPDEINWEVFEEMNKHSITTLPYQIMPQIELATELRQVWKTTN